MPSLDLSASITKITIVYINTATVTSKISTNYSNSLLLSIKNSKSTFWPIRMLRHPAAGELRMCSFWAGGISSFPFSRVREYRLLRRLLVDKLLEQHCHNLLKSLLQAYCKHILLTSCWNSVVTTCFLSLLQACWGVILLKSCWNSIVTTC
jgi:hypothetical protein